MKFIDFVPGEPAGEIFFGNDADTPSIYVCPDKTTLLFSAKAVNKILDMVYYQKIHPENCGAAFYGKWDEIESPDLQKIKLRIGYDSYYGDDHILVTPFPVNPNEGYLPPLFSVILRRGEELRIVSANLPSLKPTFGFYNHSKRVMDHLELMFELAQ